MSIWVLFDWFCFSNKTFFLNHEKKTWVNSSHKTRVLFTPGHSLLPNWTSDLLSSLKLESAMDRYSCIVSRTFNCVFCFGRKIKLYLYIDLFGEIVDRFALYWSHRFSFCECRRDFSKCGAIISDQNEIYNTAAILT